MDGCKEFTMVNKSDLSIRGYFGIRGLARIGSVGQKIDKNRKIYETCIH